MRVQEIDPCWGTIIYKLAEAQHKGACRNNIASAGRSWRKPAHCGETAVELLP